MSRLLSVQPNILIHIAAAGLALLYAWQISNTAYIRTGLQFVSPLLVIMLVHLGWIALRQGLPRGFSLQVFKRSAQTAGAMLGVIVLSNLITPMPAHAGGGDVLGSLFTVVFCVVIIAIVVGLIGLVLYLLYKIGAAIGRKLSGPGGGDNETRFFDVGSIVIAGLALGAASLEGVPNMYAFGASNSATASYFVAQPPSRVWQTLGTATSPDFPLAGLLEFIPKPVEVTIDEGTNIGATRKVKFAGREGTGYLTFVVTDRTETAATFTVKSDTSPVANWVAHRKLIYEVLPEGTGTRLNVTLEYDRRLAPAWFFTPLTKGAAYLAMDVLARDVKSRAEG